MSRYNRRSFRIRESQSEVINSSLMHIQALDSELYKFLCKEEQRQFENLELIASENIASNTVLEAASTILTDKYAEGYPGVRYYGGCEYVDMVENLARERAKKLFKAEYVNVQPHSGSNANMAVYMAVLKPGDTILGMDLAHGGHLTHGSMANFSGKLYNIVSYGVSRETELIDYDEIQRIAEENKPKLIIAGASSYSRTIDFERFRAIADSVDAWLMADIAHIAGLVVTDLHPSPMHHAHFITSTTHKTLRGPRGGIVMIGKDGENTLGITSRSGRSKKWSEVLDSSLMPGIQGGPLMHIIAAKAAAFKEASDVSFLGYQQQVIRNAQTLVSIFNENGIRTVSGGTDNHLLVLDLTELDISGKDAQVMLDLASITVNKNLIPYDSKSPFVTSGIRIGTPVITSRGMTEDDMNHVAYFIIRVLKSGGNKKVISTVREAVHELTSHANIRSIHDRQN